jgi:tetratricopeptide (TPR) repeat protein
VSQTTGNGQGQFERLKQNHLDLTRMIKQGRSFSGHERNCCFLNLGKERFATVSAISGLDFDDDGRALALVDWDHDGDLDLWVLNRTAPRLRFLRNETPTRNHFLSLRLEGDGVSGNRDAIGARVEVVSSEQLEVRSEQWTVNSGQSTDSSSPNHQSSIINQKSLRAGEGFLAQSSKWLHFGLGDETDIAEIRVRWPDGTRETFDFAGLDVDRRYRLVQGSGTVEPAGSGPRVTSLQPSTQPTAPVSDAARIPLVTMPPGPRIEVAAEDGIQVRVGAGQPVLVNLWASWCAPCVAELKEMAAREREIRDAGLQVVALSVDGLGKRGGKPKKAEATLKRIGFPFSSRAAVPKDLEMFQAIHDAVVKTQRPLPVPTSFLYDPEGRISVIYKGPLSIDGLLADLEHAGRTRRQRRQHAALLPGRMIEDPRASLPLDLTEAFFYVELGFLYDASDRLEEAEAQFRDALAIMPEYAYAHFHLGISQQQQGKEEEARKSFGRAVRIDPNHAKAHLNLGAALYRLGEADKAREHLEHAARSEPSLLEAHFNLGNLLFAQKDLDGAASRFRDVLEIDPHFALAHVRLGDLYVQQENPRTALHHYREAKRVDPRLTGLEKEIREARAQLQRQSE